MLKGSMSKIKNNQEGFFHVHHPSLNQLEFRNVGFSWEQKKARVPQGDMKIKIDACFLGELFAEVYHCRAVMLAWTAGLSHHGIWRKTF